MQKYIIYHLILLQALYSCIGKGEKADAYGNFEAVEVIISSEANGKLLSFQLEEGDELEANQIIGYVDTIQLHLNKKHLQASILAIKSKTQNVHVQIAVLENQKKNLIREKNRIEKLLADSAATTKQYDDIIGQLDVVGKQIVATKSQLNTANRGLLGEVPPLEVKIEQIEDQIQKCIVINPKRGTVLTKYAYVNEVTSFGKPLFKIADLKNITLRAYVSGNQLSNFKIGQKVKVNIDQQDGMKELSGHVTWISSSAEFTPKVIQTKEERVNLVYAFKVLVKNDGELKIGMPGEIYFN